MLFDLILALLAALVVAVAPGWFWAALLRAPADRAERVVYSVALSLALVPVVALVLIYLSGTGVTLAVAVISPAVVFFSGLAAHLRFGPAKDSDEPVAPIPASPLGASALALLVPAFALAVGVIIGVVPGDPVPPPITGPVVPGPGVLALISALVLAAGLVQLLSVRRSRESTEPGEETGGLPALSFPPSWRRLALPAVLLLVLARGYLGPALHDWPFIRGVDHYSNAVMTNRMMTEGSIEPYLIYPPGFHTLIAEISRLSGLDPLEVFPVLGPALLLLPTLALYVLARRGAARPRRLLGGPLPPDSELHPRGDTRGGLAVLRALPAPARQGEGGSAALRPGGPRNALRGVRVGHVRPGRDDSRDVRRVRVGRNGRRGWHGGGHAAALRDGAPARDDGHPARRGSACSGRSCSWETAGGAGVCRRRWLHATVLLWALILFAGSRTSLTGFPQRFGRDLGVPLALLAALALVTLLRSLAPHRRAAAVFAASAAVLLTVSLVGVQAAQGLRWASGSSIQVTMTPEISAAGEWLERHNTGGNIIVSPPGNQVPNRMMLAIGDYSALQSFPPLQIQNPRDLSPTGPRPLLDVIWVVTHPGGERTQRILRERDVRYLVLYKDMPDRPTADFWRHFEDRPDLYKTAFENGDVLIVEPR